MSRQSLHRRHTSQGLYCDSLPILGEAPLSESLAISCKYAAFVHVLVHIQLNG